jgi:hypothetical protein
MKQGNETRKKIEEENNNDEIDFKVRRALYII